MPFGVPTFNTQRSDDERLAQIRRQLQQQTGAFGRQAGADYASRGLFQSGIPQAGEQQRQQEAIGQIGQAATQLGLGRQQATEEEQKASRDRAFQNYMQQQQFGQQYGMERLQQQGRLGEIGATGGQSIALQQLRGEQELGQLQTQLADAQRNRDWQSAEQIQNRMQEIELQSRGFGQQTGERVGTQQYQGNQADLERQAAREQQMNALNFQYSQLQAQADQAGRQQDWQAYQNAQDRLQQLETQGRALQQENSAEYARQQYGAGMQQLQGQQGLEQQYLGSLYGLGSQQLGLGAEQQGRREQDIIGLLQGNIGYNQQLGNQVLGYEMQRAQQPYQYQLGQAGANQDYLRNLGAQTYGSQMQADREFKSFQNQGGIGGQIGSSLLGAGMGYLSAGGSIPGLGGGGGGTAMLGQYAGGFKPQLQLPKNALQYNPYALGR